MSLQDTVFRMMRERMEARLARGLVPGGTLVSTGLPRYPERCPDCRTPVPEPEVECWRCSGVAPDCALCGLAVDWEGVVVWRMDAVYGDIRKPPTFRTAYAHLDCACEDTHKQWSLEL